MTKKSIKGDLAYNLTARILDPAYQPNSGLFQRTWKALEKLPRDTLEALLKLEKPPGTTTERDGVPVDRDFLAYCTGLTDEQLGNVFRKESKAFKETGNEVRGACRNAAHQELNRRGIAVVNAKEFREGLRRGR